MMRLSIESTRAIPEFIVAQMQTPYFRQQIASRAKDASNQSSINQEDVRSFEVRLPPRASQLRYREAETRIRAQAEAMRRSAEDVDTLFNTLLHRAFTGEL